MRYSIIDRKKGEDIGLKPKYHRLSRDGQRMVVNECELLKTGMEPAEAAAFLGGELLSEGECMNQIKKLI